MRILFWSSAFLPQIGGIEVLAAKLLPAMRERGYEYLVVSSQDDGSLPPSTTYDGIPVRRFPFWQSLVDVDELAKVRQQVAKLKRSFAPDLIHINDVGRDNFFHLVTATAYQAPILVTLHGEWVPQADAIVKTTLESADWVTGCSKAILLKARELAPAIIPRSSVTYNAVAQSPVCPAPPPMQSPRVLCLGRLSKEKGFDLALSAFAIVIKHHPRARLIIAGDGPERAALTTQAVDAGLSERVEFIGWVPPEKVSALINTATIIMIPSRTESLPVVALQAAQMARPVIGTRVGGLPEIVADRQTGILVEKEDPQSLADATAFLFDHPETASRMGQAARGRAQRDFAWERHLNDYDRLYRNLIRADKAPAGR